MLNINTRSRRKPKDVFDHAERRAHLAAQIDATVKRMGITAPHEINALVRIGVSQLNVASAATAYETAIKAARQLRENQCFLLREQAF